MVSFTLLLTVLGNKVALKAKLMRRTARFIAPPAPDYGPPQWVAKPPRRRKPFPWINVFVGMGVGVGVAQFCSRDNRQPAWWTGVHTALRTGRIPIDSTDDAFTRAVLSSPTGASPSSLGNVVRSVFSSSVSEDADGLCSLIKRKSTTKLQQILGVELEEVVQQSVSTTSASTPASKPLTVKEVSADSERPPLPLLINLYGQAGVTPLMVAAFSGDKDLMTALVHLGADPDMCATLEPKKDNSELIKLQSISQSSKVHRAAEWARYITNVATGALTTENVNRDLFGAYFMPNLVPNKTLKAVDFALLGDKLDAATWLMEQGAQAPVDGVIAHWARQQAGGSSAEEEEKAKQNLLIALEKAKQRSEDVQRQKRARFPLEHRLSQRIVGQQHAISMVSSAIRRKENGWTDTDSPLVMLFLGSSGIGKTETAKLVAKYLFDEGGSGGKPSASLMEARKKEEAAKQSKDMQKLLPFNFPIPGGKGGRNSDGADSSTGDIQSNPKWAKCFIRMDMTEFQSKHEVSKFIGAPPGYIGYDEGGQLVKKLRECPNGVVLLDEVEKAHPDVLTVMLQAFDEGRLTDGQGQTVDCRGATFIMTSNLAQREIADEAVRLRDAVVKEGGHTISAVDGLTKRFKREVVQPLLRRHFGRDEFLGRINEFVFFLPFTFQEQQQLAVKELEKWADRAMKRHSIALQWSDAVVKQMAQGYDLRYGARSIKYEIDRTCIASIARAQEEGKVVPYSKVFLDIDLAALKKQREEFQARQKAAEAARKKWQTQVKAAANKSAATATDEESYADTGDAVALAIPGSQGRASADTTFDDLEAEVMDLDMVVPITVSVTPNAVPRGESSSGKRFFGLF